MPINLVCENCGSEYNLRDELAGKKLRCRNCESVMVVPSEADEASTVERGYHKAFARDRFLMKQKRMAISEKYYIYDERKVPILFIERPAHFFRTVGALVGGALLIVILMAVSFGVAAVLGGGDGDIKNPASILVLVLGIIGSLLLGFTFIIWLIPKRHITVYTDDSKSQRLLDIYQERKFELWRSSFTVADPAEGTLGRCVKVHIYSIFRKRWYVYDSEGMLSLLVREDSLIMSLMRRILPDIIRILIARTNFVIQEADGERTLGEFNRKFTLFDEYVLDMSGDREHLVDRRMAIAIGVLLDTGERR